MKKNLIAAAAAAIIVFGASGTVYGATVNGNCPGGYDNCPGRTVCETHQNCEIDADGTHRNYNDECLHGQNSSAAGTSHRGGHNGGGHSGSGHSGNGGHGGCRR